MALSLCCRGGICCFPVAKSLGLQVRWGPAARPRRVELVRGA